MKVFSLLFFLIVIFLISGCKSHSNLLELERKFPDSIVNRIPPEYSNFFKSIDTSQLTLINTRKFKYRNPVSSFFYKNAFYLQVYKIDSNYTRSIKKILHYQFQRSNNYNGSWYKDIIYGKLIVQYKIHKPERTKQVFLTLGGINTQLLISNDSIMYYNSDFNNISIKYANEVDNDIYCKIDEGSNTENLPIDLLFLKKGSSLFFFLMTIKNDETVLPPRLLYNLINSSK